MEDKIKINKNKLVLHSCCCACSAGIIEALKNNFEIILFFYNPNIHPKDEYKKREEAMKAIAIKYEVEFVEGEYDVENWINKVRGFEKEPEGAARCKICFKERLQKTAEFTKLKGAENFSTTLLSSHLKNEEVIEQIGKELSNEFNINFLDFESLELDRQKINILGREIAKNLGLYRQKYCGCCFSFNKNSY